MIYQQLFNGKSKAILFANYTSNIFTNYNLKDFKNGIKIEFESLNKWFKAKRLTEFKKKKKPISCNL